MKVLKDILEHLIQSNELSTEQTQFAMQNIMTGAVTDCEIAAFLALLRAKGHTVNELTVAAETMLNHAHLIQFEDIDCVDIVGTGGDGLSTFNVSTFASFVVAGAGVPVAKHGNRSVSSKSGSSNLLETAGIHFSDSPTVLRNQLEKAGITFLFAPLFHPAMKHAVPARQALGIRTLFNLLGPILNPAQVSKQVIGVFSKDWLEPLSLVLENLGSKRHLVLCSEEGMDEISVCSPTRIVEFNEGTRTTWNFDPHRFNMAHSDLQDAIVSSPQESLEIGMSVLSGSTGCAFDMVCLNAASAIYCFDNNLSFDQAVQQAKESIISGKALQALKTLQTLNEVGNEHS